MGLIRLLLAISVVIAHSSSIFGLRLLDGPLAVEVFFMISGFYMALILTEKYNKPSHYKLFIGNRFLKIFPVYYTVLLLCLIFRFINYYVHPQLTNSFVFLDNPTNLNFLYLMFLAIINLIIFGQDFTLFLGVKDNGLIFTSHFRDSNPPVYDFLLIPQAWSLSLELMFYLVAPFIVKLKTKHLLIIAGISLFCRLFFYYKGLRYDPWNYRFFPFEILLFITGILAYRIFCQIKSLELNILPKALLFFYLTYLIVYQQLPHRTIKQIILFSISFISLPFIFYLTKNSKRDSHIGELSYPIYIVHFLVIDTITSFTSLNHQYLGLVVSVISIALSILLLKFIVKPIDRIRQQRIKKVQIVSS